MHTYYEITNGGDLSKLKKSLSFASPEELAERWAKINDDITEIVGQSESFTEILRLRISKAEHLEAAHNRGERWRLTLAAVEDEKIREIQETSRESTSLTETLLTLSKEQGYRLESSKITTLEYFTLIKMSNGANKK